MARPRFRQWAVVAVGAAVVAAAAPAALAVSRPNDVASWQVTSSAVLAASIAGQGVTTVTTGGRTRLITRGWASAADPLVDVGWWHIGDPGSFRGTIVDAYQGASSATSKLFTLTVGTRVYRYVHPLAATESYHNSFAAVSPDGRWLVSGEWGTAHRLLVFSMPRPHGSSAAAHTLALAGVITLSRSMRDVQGCAFAAATTLMCSTNDPGTALYPVARQLLAVRLAHPLDGSTVTGRPTLVGSVPQQTVCPSSVGESEGIDVRGSRMLVAVNAACAHKTQLFALAYRPRTSEPFDLDPQTFWTVGLANTTSGTLSMRRDSVRSRVEQGRL